MKPRRLHILSTIALACTVALSASAVFGQSHGQGQGSCSMAGTWYGGGDAAKYLTYIAPGAGSDFSLVSDGAFSLGTLGLPVKTIYTGSITRNQGKFDVYAMSFVNDTTAFPAPVPQINAAHATATLVDCDTLRFDFDFFGGYLWNSNKTPFVDTPDYVVSPPPFSEVYHRMPTTCPQCAKH